VFGMFLKIKRCVMECVLFSDAKSLWLLHTGNQFVQVHCVEIAAPQRNEDARHCRLGRAK